MTNRNEPPIEAVARAIKSKWLTTPCGELGPNLGVAWIDLAKAAIAAMGESPSGEAKNASSDAPASSPARCEISLVESNIPCDAALGKHSVSRQVLQDKSVAASFDEWWKREFNSETALGYNLKLKDICRVAWKACAATKPVMGSRNQYLINVKQPCRFAGVMASVVTNGNADIIEVELLYAD
jgi:hypothetical protein